MLRVLNQLSLVQKMVLILFGSVFVPILFQVYFLSSNVEKNLKDELYSKLETTIDMKTEDIHGQMEGIMTLMRRYDQNLTLNDTLDHYFYSENDYYDRYAYIKELIVADVPYINQVKNILFTTNNNTIINGGYVRKEENPYKLMETEQIISEYNDEDNEITYQLSLVKDRVRSISERNVSIRRPMNYYEEYRFYHKEMRMDLNLSYLSEQLHDIGLFEQLMVVDEDGYILFASNDIGQQSTFTNFNDLQRQEGVKIYRRSIEGFPFYLVGVFEEGAFVQQFEEYQHYSVVISGISIILGTFFILIVAMNILRRTKTVVNLSEQIARGEFRQIDTSKSGHDEFAELEHSMNIMSQRLEELIENEYKSQLMQVKFEKEAVKSKLYALQSQVNPHFLFNALESIRLKAYANEETKTAQMIKNMAKMFRNILKWEEDIIPIEEEITFLLQFLSLQKYRFEEDFTYEIINKAQGEAIKIPKMIIQPLVENACIHQMNQKEEPLRVKIHIELEDNYVVISVMDNGMGMDEEKLASIRSNLERELSGKNVGIYNVYQRLKLYYNEQASFTISSIVGQGTTCIIKIPQENSNLS